MTIESDEEYQRACAEYELLKDETGKDYRKQELVEALYEWESSYINEGREYDDFLRQEQRHKNL